jgi:hypothetical protein
MLEMWRNRMFVARLVSSVMLLASWGQAGLSFTPVKPIFTPSQ